MPSDVVRAPAKLTLSLRIMGVRDDGYHLLDAEMVTLELHDTLTFAGGDGLTIGGPFAAGIATGEENLVRRALRAVGRTAAVRVDKQIPAGGGLGGGSADAAAVLRWAGCDDLDVAARLGADVPFCLAGGRARVQGVGEVAGAAAVRGPRVHAGRPAARRSRPSRSTGPGTSSAAPAATVPTTSSRRRCVVEPRLAALARPDPGGGRACARAGRQRRHVVPRREPSRPGRRRSPPPPAS